MASGMIKKQSNIETGCIYGSIGSTSSSNSSTGITINANNYQFTVKEGQTVTIIGGGNGQVGLDWYTLQIFYSVINAETGATVASQQSHYTNLNNHSHRSGSFCFKIDTPGTYYIRANIVPQAGAVATIYSYNSYQFKGIYIIS